MPFASHETDANGGRDDDCENGKDNGEGESEDDDGEMFRHSYMEGRTVLVVMREGRKG